jgi:hypothetical protein
MKKLLPIFIAVLAIAIAGFMLKPHSAYAFNANNVIDDGIFDRAGSMSAAQIDTWLNTNFPSSCISTNNGFSAPDPTGYSPNPSQFFYSGSPVTAGQVIYDASQAYGMNPQVMIATLEKEEGLVSGGSGCSSWRYASAVGYGCTDSGTNTHDYSYPGGGLVTPLYYINGSPVNSITGSCVNSGPKAGFTEQVIHAAWLFSFSRHKSEGDTAWAVIKGNWNNCDDNNTCPAAWNIPASDACYSGFMTQGTFKRCPTDSAAVFYDGYTTIDGTSTHMDNGATAAFYVYTPHFAGNSSFDTIFQNWFGSFFDVYSWQLTSQYAYTDSSKNTVANMATLHAGDKVYVGFTAKNTGDATWSNTGANPIMVGTANPLDRTSSFGSGSGWLSGSRPVLMKEASVAPGGTGTFEFWMTAPARTGVYNERFSLIANNLTWFNDIGLSYFVNVIPPVYAWQFVGQWAYTDSNRTIVANMANLHPGDKVYVRFTAKNIGNVTWNNTGANALMVGTSDPLDRISSFSPGSGWLSGSRPALMKDPSLAPGSTGTFEFTMTAPSTLGEYNERFSLIANDLTWLNDPGLSLYAKINP